MLHLIMQVSGISTEKETPKPDDYKISEPRAFNNLIFAAAESKSTEDWMKRRYGADSAAYIALKPPQNFPKKDNTLKLAEGDIIRLHSNSGTTYIYVLVPTVVPVQFMNSTYETTSFVLHDTLTDSSQSFECPTLYRLEDRTKL